MGSCRERITAGHPFRLVWFFCKVLDQCVMQDFSARHAALSLVSQDFSHDSARRDAQPGSCCTLGFILSHDECGFSLSNSAPNVSRCCGLPMQRTKGSKNLSGVMTMTKGTDEWLTTTCALEVVFHTHTHNDVWVCFFGGLFLVLLRFELLVPQCFFSSSLSLFAVLFRPVPFTGSCTGSGRAGWRRR